MRYWGVATRDRVPDSTDVIAAGRDSDRRALPSSAHPLVCHWHPLCSVSTFPLVRVSDGHGRCSIAKSVACWARGAESSPYDYSTHPPLPRQRSATSRCHTPLYTIVSGSEAGCFCLLPHALSPARPRRYYTRYVHPYPTILPERSRAYRHW